MSLLLGLISCYTVFVWLYCWINRKNVTSMTGMTITMALSMSSSLMVGALLGIQLQNSFFLSTAVSILIGLFIGLMSGIPFGLLAIADGTLSGVMGGMMGAMTGAMTEPKFNHTLIQLLYLIYFITCLIIYFLNRQSKIGTQRVYLAFLVLVLLSFTSFAFGKHLPTKAMPMQEVTIEANEFSFHPSQLSIKSGEKVKITVTNTGKLEHRIKLYSEMHQSHPLIVNVLPGKSESIIITANHGGAYHFICTVPGHKEKGMHGVLEVS